MKNFYKLKNPSPWRRLSIATWKAPNNPTIYASMSFDATKALGLLDQLNQWYEPQGKPWTQDSVASHGVLNQQGLSPKPTSVGDKNPSVKITMTHLVAKAASLILHEYPDLNGIIRWRRIYLRKTVDLFLQVAIQPENQNEKPDLSGAKINSCETKSIAEIAFELQQKSSAIRKKEDPQFKATLRLLKWVPPLFLRWVMRLMEFFIHDLGLSLPKMGLPPDPFGSAMITSVGSLRSPAGYGPLVPLSRTPFIICVGMIEQKPWVVDGQVVARPIIDMKFTLDHRFIDGVTGAKMANYLKKIMEEPERYIQ